MRTSLLTSQVPGVKTWDTYSNALGPKVGAILES